MRRTLVLVALPIAIAFILAFIFVEISALSLALAKALLGSALFYVLIKYGHDEFDHIALWQENPFYGAILLLGYAIIVAAAFAGS